MYHAVVFWSKHVSDVLLRPCENYVNLWKKRIIYVSIKGAWESYRSFSVTLTIWIPVENILLGFTVCFFCSISVSSWAARTLCWASKIVAGSLDCSWINTRNLGLYRKRFMKNILFKEKCKQPAPPIHSSLRLDNHQQKGVFRMAATVLKQGILTKLLHGRGRCLKRTAPPSPPLHSRSDVSIFSVDCCQGRRFENTSLENLRR